MSQMGSSAGSSTTTLLCASVCTWQGAGAGARFPCRNPGRMSLSKTEEDEIRELENQMSDEKSVRQSAASWKVDLGRNMVKRMTARYTTNGTTTRRRSDRGMWPLRERKRVEWGAGHDNASAPLAWYTIRGVTGDGQPHFPQNLTGG